MGTQEDQATSAVSQQEGGLLALSLLALVTGGLDGALAAVFRLTLEAANHLRATFVAWAHGQAAVGFALVVVATAAAAAVAASLVRRLSPQASGSGIPHVEAVLKGETAPAPLSLVPIKFVGGALAIGAGLALGREGPSIQMGASVSHLVGRAFGRGAADCRVLMAAGAGAGLATAFNAPIAGAVFVLEELVQRFEPRIAIAALGASATAISVARLLLGDAPDFHVVELAHGDAGTRPLYFLFGAFAGLIAVAYNRTLLAALALADRWRRAPAELRAAAIGALAGGLAWYSADFVGGGDPVTQAALAGATPLAAVPAVFAVRFLFGPASYAAGTPGGLFAPMLVLGAQIGLLCGAGCAYLLPGLDIHTESFALVGMAAFFAGVVRAPVTGVILVTEMTGSVVMLLPLLSACATAMLIPALIGEPPIYESLGKLAVRPGDRNREVAAAPGDVAAPAPSERDPSP